MKGREGRILDGAEAPEGIEDHVAGKETSLACLEMACQGGDAESFSSLGRPFQVREDLVQ